MFCLLPLSNFAQLRQLQLDFSVVSMSFEQHSSLVRLRFGLFNQEGCLLHRQAIAIDAATPYIAWVKEANAIQQCVHKSRLNLSLLASIYAPLVAAAVTF